MTWVGFGLGLALLLGSGGLVVRTACDFADLVDRPAPDPSSLRADGVVVFSGGVRRVWTGLRLLRDGRAPRLLVAGGDDVRTFRETDGDLFACCIDLLPGSRNTAEDAAAIARWARDHRMTSVLAVTTDVHMPRALLELHSADRALRVTAYPVSSRGGEDGVDQYTMSLREYAKWLLVRVRLAVRGTLGRLAGAVQAATRMTIGSKD